MENLRRYRKDLERLFKIGRKLRIAILHESFPRQVKRTVEHAKKMDPDIKAEKDIPPFSAHYQAWYSEALAVVRQLLPDRLEDFCAYYQAPKNRKGVTAQNYRISDFLSGYPVTDSITEKSICGPKNVIALFDQQFQIVSAAAYRLQSSLFDIKQLAQAELFGSELEGAKELLGKGFLDPAGVVAGAVMEKHLVQICENHAIKLGRKKLTITNLNDSLREKKVIGVPDWRFNQRLGDLRNLCAHHNKGDEVTKEQVAELIDGVAKLLKTLS